uniref:C-type mannose receptor 2-like n=1 Tax=Semicossyphus pulcher TaxID=241346 RepID=UPI0037E96442
MLAVSALVCAMMALTTATALAEVKAAEDQGEEPDLVKRLCFHGHWSHFNGRYFRYFPTCRTWAQAEKACQSVGGNLASVHNIEEYHAIQRLILSSSHAQKEAWVGGFDAPEDGVWLWSDGSRFVYTNWCRGEPNNGAGTGQHCVQINYSGKSNCGLTLRREVKQVCYKFFFPIIVIIIIRNMKMLAVSALVCAMLALTTATGERHLVKRTNDWVKINGRLFRYFPTSVTWAEAEKNCQSAGGNLGAVHSVDEYHAVQSLILRSSHAHTPAWIGGTDAHHEGDWIWSDGSRFTYTDWCRGEPNNAGWSQHCLQMNYGSAKCWDDVSCSTSLPYVCAKRN